MAWHRPPAAYIRSSRPPTPEPQNLDVAFVYAHAPTTRPSLFPFEVSCNGCGWFGVGVAKIGTTRSFMTSGGQGTDVVYCDGTQPDGLPQRHRLSSYGGIAPGSTNTRVLRGPLDVCDVAQGTMTFTRKVEALDDSENAIAVDTSGDTGTKFAMAWAYHASSTTVSYHTGNMGHTMIALVPKRGAAESPRPTCASVSGELAEAFCNGVAYGSNGLKPDVANVKCGVPGDTVCNKADGDDALCCALAPASVEKPSTSYAPYLTSI